jgi:hypothetical protein
VLVVSEVSEIGLLVILLGVGRIGSKGWIVKMSGKIIKVVFMEVFAGLAYLDLREVDFKFGDEGFGVKIIGLVLLVWVFVDRLAIEVEIC